MNQCDPASCVLLKKMEGREIILTDQFMNKKKDSEAWGEKAFALNL